MARLPFPDLAAAPEQVRETFASMPFDLAVMHMFSHAQGAFTAWLQFGAAALGRNALDADVQELVICLVTLSDSPRYEYAHHRQALLASGFTETQVIAIERGDLESAALTPAQQVAATFAREVHAGVRASDETLAEVRRHFSDRQVIELILCIGLYMLNSRVAENGGVTLEDDRQFAKPGQPIPQALYL